MSSISLDHEAAKAVLRAAAGRAKSAGYQPQSELATNLQAIIEGSHLTYKYILVTALLAKAVDPRVDPRALQAGAKLSGAYDARSLCHSVIVPNEASLLDNALGGSNEPFLNKPARYPQISVSNPVRQGQDKRTLIALHGLLGKIGNSEVARVALQDALFFAVRRITRDSKEFRTAIQELTGGRYEIAAYVKRLISKAEHGESSVLATASILWLMAITRGEKWTIDVHPVNESGASSNEVSDIDVRMASKLVLTAEVKDKPFIAKDVDHAVGRVRRSGFSSLHFITGPRALLVGASVETVQLEAATNGIELHVIPLQSLAEAVIPFAPSETTLKDFAEVVATFASEARVRDETLNHLREITKNT